MGHRICLPTHPVRYALFQVAKLAFEFLKMFGFQHRPRYMAPGVEIQKVLTGHLDHMAARRERHFGFFQTEAAELAPVNRAVSFDKPHQVSIG